ncbi:thiol-disulfide oxidoreductase DCC family protein, partial [Microterricola pindariensis]
LNSDMILAPSTRPALLVFDGDCGFCTSTVGWLRRWLPAMPDASPYQWTELAEYGLSEADAAAKVWLVVGGRRLGGHAAVAGLLTHQPAAALRLLGHLMMIPPISWAAAAAYALVARYRFALPGGTPACRVGQS